MTRSDDWVEVVEVVKDFLLDLDIVEFTDKDIDEWSKNLAHRIVNKLNSSRCDHSPVYPPLWKVDE